MSNVAQKDDREGQGSRYKVRARACVQYEHAVVLHPSVWALRAIRAHDRPAPATATPLRGLPNGQAHRP